MKPCVSSREATLFMKPWKCCRKGPPVAADPISLFVILVGSS